MFIPSPDIQKTLAQAYAEDRRGAARGGRLSLPGLDRLVARVQGRRARRSAAGTVSAAC